MKYDYAIKKMSGYGYPAPYDRDEKLKRIWQVIEIERDDMGSPVRDLDVIRNGLTYDEAGSVCNQLKQELNRVEREKQSNEK